MNVDALIALTESMETHALVLDQYIKPKDDSGFTTFAFLIVVAKS